MIAVILPPDPNGIAFAVPSDAPTIAVQAVVALPALTPGERMILAGALRSAIAQTEGYSHGSLLAMTVTPSGTVQALAADHLRIGLHLQSGRSKEALTILEAILARPAFLPEALNADIRAAASPREIWERIGQLPMAPPRSVAPEEASAVWAKVVRPEQLVVAFAGTGAVELTERWESRKIVWPALPGPDYRAEAKPIAPPPSLAQVAVLDGALMKPDSDLGPTLLALTALGAGKGSLGWHSLRTERGASYRIEATLAGVPDGWRPQLVFDLSPSDDGADVKDRLTKAVESLTETDLARARGYLAAALRGETYDILFAPSGTRLGRSLSDRTYLAAYLRLKTGRIASLPAVPEMTLEDLKATLRGMLEGATLRLQL